MVRLTALSCAWDVDLVAAVAAGNLQGKILIVDSRPAAVSQHFD